MTSETNRIPMHWVAMALLALASLANPRVTKSSPRVVHVFVALADNQHQGIIPVPAALGNWSDAQHNLYWGAAFGVKTFFKSGDEWEAYTLKAALNGWIANEDDETIHRRAAQAYDKYQKCGARAALRLFSIN
jgi:hypothetical protein